MVGYTAAKYQGKGSNIEGRPVLTVWDSAKTCLGDAKTCLGTVDGNGERGNDDDSGIKRTLTQ